MKHLDHVATGLIWIVILLIVYATGVGGAVVIALLFGASWIIQKGNS